MKKPQILYHYTSLMHLESIAAARCITRTCSNLRSPGNTPAEELAACNFKPVVWMTDSTSPEGLCVPPSKQRIRLSIPMQRYYTKWDIWARKNRIDPKWRKSLTTGMNWQSWYISEIAIPLDDVCEIFDTSTNTVIERDAQGRLLLDGITDTGNEFIQDIIFTTHLMNNASRAV